MPIEFVVSFNASTFPNHQALPDIYEEEGFKGNNEIYLSSPHRYRYKVQILRQNNEPILVIGDKWRQFATENFNTDVAWLHFVEEGDDSFYVTGYYNNGTEVIGYGGIDIRNRFPRYMTRVLPYDNIVNQTMHVDFIKELPADNQIWINGHGVSYQVDLMRVNIEGTDGPYAYQIDNHCWQTMVDDMFLTPGMKVVYLKKDVDELWLTAFAEDGRPTTDLYFHGAITLKPIQRDLSHLDLADDRMKHRCQWKWHTEHFHEGIDTFYKEFAYIKPQQRLAIPAEFQVDHPMHFYTKALMIHKDHQELMRMKMDFHKEQPSRTNHVNVYGQWKLFARICNFKYDKMIRFRFMRMENDRNADVDDAPEYPVFHLC